jgi:glycosyltransferase involved in cell wall biosynthesis
MQDISNKRIIRLITRLNNGGPAKQAVWLSHFLREKGYETTLVAGRTEGEEDDISWYAEKYGVTPVYLDNLGRSISLLPDLKALFSLLRILKKERPDVIHTHMSKAGFIGRVAAVLYNIGRRDKIKIVHTFHGHVFHSYFSNLKTNLFLFIEKALAKKTDRIIVISEHQYEEIHYAFGIGDASRISVIPLGIDYAGKKESPNSTDTAVVGMMGRIAPVKNYGLAVDIAAELKKRYVHAEIRVAGGGDSVLLAWLRDKTRELSVERYIHFLGNVEEPESFWKDIDLALITSKNEGTPVSLIEAMFTEIPFVAASVGGIPDMTAGAPRQVGNLRYYDNCIQVDSQNPNDYVDAIEYYVTDRKKRSEAGQAAWKLAEKQYSISRLVDDIDTLYNSLFVNGGRNQQQ